MPNWSLPTLDNLVWLPGLIVGFTVHELAHALVAYWMGDRSDLTRERLTLNPIKHVSWWGLAAFVVLGFSWAKPVRFRPAAFKRANLGSLLVSLAGVTANALLAFLLLIVLLVMTLAGVLAAEIVGADRRLLVEILSAGDGLPPLGMLVASLTGQVVNVNVVLAIFNLLPIPAFDGFHALLSLWRLITRHKWPDQERRQVQAAVAFEEGNHHARRGQTALAVDAWRRSVTLDPNFYGAYHNLGLAYLQTGQRSAALGALADARRTAPGENEQSQANALLAQAGWDGESALPVVSTGALPELLLPPSPLDEAAGQGQAFKIVAIVVGAILGLAAYMTLMLFLALLAAGMRL